jgi:hypothetical protein
LAGVFVIEINIQTASRRMDAIKLSDAINGMSGVPVSEFAKETSLKWAKGEITYEEAKKILLKNISRYSTDGYIFYFS